MKLSISSIVALASLLLNVLVAATALRPIRHAKRLLLDKLRLYRDDFKQACAQLDLRLANSEESRGGVSVIDAFHESLPITDDDSAELASLGYYEVWEEKIALVTLKIHLKRWYEDLVQVAGHLPEKVYRSREDGAKMSVRAGNILTLLETAVFRLEHPVWAYVLGKWAFIARRMKGKQQGD